MKTLVTIIVLLALLGNTTKNIVAQEGRVISDKEILNFANANLDKFREMVSSMHNDFGFPTAESLKKATLGAPYEFVLLHPDFINDSIYTDDKNYFYNRNRSWDVPVLYNETIRSFMRIFNQNDTLKFTGAGGAGLGKIFEDCEKHYSIPKSGKRYFLHPEIIYQCDFIVLFDSTNNYRFYPLYYQDNDLNSYCLRRVSYNKHNSMKSFFDTHKTQVYTSSKQDIVNASVEFEMYPNPALVNVNMRGYIPIQTKTAYFSVYDNTGRKLFDEQLYERGNIVIELKKVIFPNSGIYICNLVLDGNTFTRKIIVQ
jgi:hypothetical protein